MKILLVRSDNLGDFILTLPVEKWISQTFSPPIETVWLVSVKNVAVLEEANFKGRVITISHVKNFLAQLREGFSLASKLRGLHLDAACVFQAPWWVAFGIWQAKIPKRFGVASKPWAWFFYNFPLRQKRSEALKHELGYNFDLAFGLAEEFQVGRASRSVNPESMALSLSASLESMDQAAKVISDNEIRDPFVILHPGMAGSARNWEPERYGQLAMELQKRGFQVVVTGTEIDRAIVEESGLSRLPGVVNLLGKTPGRSIWGLVAKAKAVIAPSTGVGHISASLGVPTVGIYSPVRVQAPRRWGFLGKAVKVLVPEVECPGQLKCVGSTCPKWDCMRQIKVEDVLQALENL